MHIEADASGSVWKVNVKAGDMVAVDDVVLVLESMKMEIPIEVSINAEVIEVLVEEGDLVDEGQALIRIRPVV